MATTTATNSVYNNLVNNGTAPLGNGTYSYNPDADAITYTDMYGGQQVYANGQLSAPNVSQNTQTSVLSQNQINEAAYYRGEVAGSDGKYVWDKTGAQSWAPTPTPAPTPSASPAATPAPTGTASLADRQTLYQSGGGSSTGVVKYAMGNGMTPEQIDSYFGWTPGYAASQIPASTPAPAPSSSSTDSAAPTQGAAASQLKDPVAWNVTPDQTVEARMRSLLDPNNPLMQQARTTGLQNANDRGLINSSMAVSAVQDSMMNKALPIAQQDSMTSASAAQANMQAVNQFARDYNLNLNDQQKMALAQKYDLQKMDVQQRNQLALNAQQFGFQTQLNDQNFGFQTKLNDQNFGYQTKLTQQQFNNQLEALKTQFANQLASTAAAGAEARSQNFQTAATAVMTTLQKQITDINANTQFTGTEGAAAKQTMISAAQSAAQSSLEVLAHAAGDIDISEWLDKIFA